MNKGAIFNESAAVAQVDFRVRCETLSHGEEVLLVRSDDPNLTSVRIDHSKSFVSKTVSETPTDQRFPIIRSLFLFIHLHLPFLGTAPCSLVQLPSQMKTRFKTIALLVSSRYSRTNMLFSEWGCFIGGSNPLMWVRKIGKWMKMFPWKCRTNCAITKSLFACCMIVNDMRFKTSWD